MPRRIEAAEARERLNRAAARVDRDLVFMEVCGTHTVSAFRTGVHTLLPKNVRLLSGPGCPVCVTSQTDIDQLISLASIDDALLCTYGDMIRVCGSDGASLQDARAAGADVRIIYSALDVVDLAAQTPDREVIFAAVGFETTAPATAAAIQEAARRELPNFSAFACHKLVMPAMHALLSGDVAVDGFLLPGHVSIIIGTEPYRPIIDEYQLPCVISGFEGEQMLASLAMLVEQCADGVARLDNLYPQAVDAEGNRVAMALLDEVFETTSAQWRGLAEIPDSGLAIRDAYRRHDASKRFALPQIESAEPAGCRCGEVITGRCSPADCKLFGTACTPVHAIGPCMVSSEGTCAAWFKYNRAPAVAAQ